MCLGEMNRDLAYLAGAIRQALAVRRRVVALRAPTGAYVNTIRICLVLLLFVAVAAGGEQDDYGSRKYSL